MESTAQFDLQSLRRNLRKLITLCHETENRIDKFKLRYTSTFRRLKDFLLVDGEISTCTTEEQQSLMLLVSDISLTSNSRSLETLDQTLFSFVKSLACVLAIVFINAGFLDRVSPTRLCWESLHRVATADTD